MGRCNAEASHEAVWKLMSEKAEDVWAFVSVSHYFTKLIKEKMTLDDKKVQTLSGKKQAE